MVKSTDKPFYDQSRALKRGGLRPMQVKFAQLPCCGWFALKLAMSGEHMTTKADLRAFAAVPMCGCIH